MSLFFYLSKYICYIYIYIYIYTHFYGFIYIYINTIWSLYSYLYIYLMCGNATARCFVFLLEIFLKSLTYAKLSRYEQYISFCTPLRPPEKKFFVFWLFVSTKRFVWEPIKIFEKYLRNPTISISGVQLVCFFSVRIKFALDCKMNIIYISRHASCNPSQYLIYSIFFYHIQTNISNAHISIYCSHWVKITP